MDKKRKSVFASHHDVKETTISAKKNRRESSPNTHSIHGLSPAIDIREDIKSICLLVEKLTAASEHGITNLSPEILETAKNFSLALQKSPILSRPSADSSSHDTGTSPKATTSSTRCIPPLPPIGDDKLERAVFTHPGMSGDSKATYDRLEVLGDAYIELISTKLIWSQFQQMSSGQISQIRELLVKNETLAEYATQYGFDRRASVPANYLNQPKRWTKTKGDIFEAYVAAVVLSHPDGYTKAETWLTRLWSSKLATIEESQSYYQAKEVLARKLSGKDVKLKYVDEKEPVQHGGGMQTYYIGVYLTGWGWSNKHLGSGQGSNKSIAGNRAAQQALESGCLIQDIVATKAARGTERS
ncbi:ribonuclease III domain-containing protein [Aspergillus unguis]